MTGLIAGAILLIVASAATLIFGWIGSNETLIWISIGGSVGAAVCLALAYYRGKQETRPRRNPRPATAKTPPAAAQTPAAEATTSVSQDTQAIAAVDQGATSVVVDAAGKFHSPGCPQARGSGERIDRDEAKQRGLEACRICRP